MTTRSCATCGPVPAGAIRHLDHDSPHGHETHECGSSAGLDWTKTKEHEMSAKPHTCYAIHCDNCDASFDHDEFTPHYTSPDQAHEDLKVYEWLLLRDGRTYCTSCDHTAPDCACGEDADCDADTCEPGCPCLRHEEVPPITPCEHCGFLAENHAGRVLHSWKHRHPENGALPLGPAATPAAP